MNKIDFSGIYPPIPTSFDREGNVSVKAIRDNLNLLNQFGLRGYLVLGSNGEYILLSNEEKLKVFEAARSTIPGNKLMLAGTGCQSTKETIALTKEAAGTGADAAVVISPSYYKGLMNADVLKKHFHAVADASPIPVLLYNMPACTGIDLDADTIIKIAEHENIVGLKDSGGNIVKIGEIRQALGDSFQILAGSGSFLLAALSMGACGGILALANIAPQETLDILDAYQNKELEKAQELQIRMIPVNDAVTKKWSIPALKAAMDLLGMQGGTVREPLQPVSDNIKEVVRSILTRAGIRKYELVSSQG